MNGIDPSFEINRLRIQFEGSEERQIEVNSSGYGSTLDVGARVEVQLHTPIRISGEWKRVRVRSNPGRENPNIRWLRRT